MTEEVIKELQPKGNNEDGFDNELSDFHATFLKKANDRLNCSRSFMAKYHSKWDTYDCAFRGDRVEDKDDVEADRQGEPPKQAVALTYSQILTFVAFLFSLYFQRRTFFELNGTGPEDTERRAALMSSLLERDLNYNKWASRLYQLLIDIGRFGFGVFKTVWTEETGLVRSEEKIPASTILGFQVAPERTEVVQKEGILFQGNRILSISPYRFFPDVSMPLTRFQDGEFCASEDLYSYHQLKTMESRGEVVGIDAVRRFTPSTWTRHGNIKESRYPGLKTDNQNGQVVKDGDKLVVTEMQWWIIPSKFKLDESEKPLGPETTPILYNVWIANDSRVIKVEPLGADYNKFSYDLAQLSPDQHVTLNEGISAMTNSLNDVINFFLNSRIFNVRKVVSNFMIYDPSMIEQADIQNKKPWIRLKAGAGRRGIDNWVKQLDVKDVTGSHVQDIQTLMGMMQLVTGISDNALGQFNKGRRSATEARNVNAGTLNRLLMVAKLIWDDCISPVGQKMVSNHQQGLTEQTLVKVLGVAGAEMREVSNSDILGRYDFEVFDGTLPSDKNQLADVLGDLLGLLLSNPQSAAVFGFDPKKLLDDIALLRGVKHASRYDLNPQGQQQILEMLGVINGGGTSTTDASGSGVPVQQPAAGTGLEQLLNGR